MSRSVTNFRFLYLCFRGACVGCCPAAELKKHGGGMCLLVAQTMASELLVGGGRLLQSSNFFIKRGTVLFVSLHSATTIFVLKTRVCLSRSDFLPLLLLQQSQSSCFSFFLPVKRALPKIASSFVGGAVQTGFVCLHGFPPPRH